MIRMFTNDETKCAVGMTFAVSAEVCKKSWSLGQSRKISSVQCLELRCEADQPSGSVPGRVFRQRVPRPGDGSTHRLEDVGTIGVRHDVQFRRSHETLEQRARLRAG